MIVEELVKLNDDWNFRTELQVISIGEYNPNCIKDVVSLLWIYGDYEVIHFSTNSLTITKP